MPREMADCSDEVFGMRVVGHLKFRVLGSWDVHRACTKDKQSVGLLTYNRRIWLK